MARRGANGEGTIYRRKDGRYEGALWVLTTEGKRKRLRLYGANRAEVHAKITDAKVQDQHGIPTADKAWRLGNYLDYWLEQVVRPNLRPTTYDLYESDVRLYLKPGLGRLFLTRLSIPVLQAFLNRLQDDGHSVNKIHKVRQVLGSALGHAMHQELVTRNVAWLVKLPSDQRAKIRPWTVEEVIRFLDIAKTHRWYPAFVLLVLYGPRRGELLGLRWCDVKLAEDELHIEQQVYRANGFLQAGFLKTAAGQRDLPLLALARQVLMVHQTKQAAARIAAGETWRGGNEADELVFTTPDGGMIEPHNFTRSFQRLCQRHGIRRIKLHHVRHTNATLLKSLGVQPRDRQLILGHSRSSMTELYEHDTMDSKRESLVRLESLIRGEQEDHQADELGGHDAGVGRQDSTRSRQISRQNPISANLRYQFALGLEMQNSPTTGVTDAGLLGLFLGDLTGNRTRIARMRSVKRSTLSDVHERTTEVRTIMKVEARRWILGCVAVNLAVRVTCR